MIVSPLEGTEAGEVFSGTKKAMNSYFKSGRRNSRVVTIGAPPEEGTAYIKRNSYFNTTWLFEALGKEEYWRLLLWNSDASRNWLDLSLSFLGRTAH